VKLGLLTKFGIQQQQQQQQRQSAHFYRSNNMTVTSKTNREFSC